MRGRFHDLGVRMAVGASPSFLLLIVMWQAFRLGSAGVVVGLVTFASQLFGVGRWDPLTLARVSAVRLAIVVLGAFSPAVCGARIPPARLLCVQ